MKKRKWDTLMFQLTINYLAIIAVVFTLIVVSWSIIQRETRISTQITDLTTPYTSIYADLAQLRRSNNAGILGIDSDETELRNSNELLDDLQNQATKLMQKLNSDGMYNRSSIDLLNTLGTYANVYKAVQESYTSLDYSGMTGMADELNRVESWIRQYLNDTGDAINARQQSINTRSTGARRGYYRIMMILGSVMILLCIAEITVSTGRIVKPIEQLCKNVEAFRLSDSLEELKEKGIPCKKGSMREIRTLATAIYSMQNTVLDQYTGEKYNQYLREKLDTEALHTAQIERRLQETQLKALQAQINPHFLFNTLNMIGQMAYLEGAEKTTDLLETFSDFFRYTVESFETDVSLEKELSNTMGYISLQKERFQDRITYEINTDPQIGSIRVPCLIIQPLVENAVSHGLRMVTEGGIVSIIAVSLPNSGFQITVSDNGCGMKAEDVEKLIAGVEQPEIDDASQHYSIGVSNVINRMRISFGTRFSYSINSSPNDGFRITLKVEGGNNA